MHNVDLHRLHFVLKPIHTDVCAVSMPLLWLNESF